MKWMLPILFLPLAVSVAAARQPFYDRTHHSQLFGQERNYRIFLPLDYEATQDSYPVIYYFHGHSDRYTLEHYDGGTKTVPDIIQFVNSRRVIVVSVDGYVAGHYTGFYGGTPWDVRREGGAYDFGTYFRELMEHIDGTFRTLTDRRHRATSGLSMGGFMSLWLSARFPQLIGSASAFNPGPEFYVGDKGRRVLWRPKDHVRNHTQTKIRLVRASGDYISQYHEETRTAYAREEDVRFEYRLDDFPRHAATSIGETFQFHADSFADAALDRHPDSWDHTSAYCHFSVWGYSVEVAGEEAALVYLEDVTQGGLSVRTRRWAPDGPPVPETRITLATAPFYQPGARYRLFDHQLSRQETTVHEVTADATGRLHFSIDGSGHRIGVSGPGTGGQPPVVLPLDDREAWYIRSNQDGVVPLRIFNPRGQALTDITVEVSSRYPTVSVLRGSHLVARIEPGSTADLPDSIRVSFTAGSGYYAPARLDIKLRYDDWHEITRKIDLRIEPEILKEPEAFEILDGRTVRLNVFRQAGNQGGGGPVEREVTEGRGNGNGKLEPGEEATIWIRVAQGIDPFDKGNWYRCKVRTDSAWLSDAGDIQEEKQREWTGAMERTSLIRLDPQTPPGSRLDLVLDNETWSFHFTPDFRFGGEPMYQAVQIHQHQLHRLELSVAGK